MKQLSQIPNWKAMFKLHYIFNVSSGNRLWHTLQGKPFIIDEWWKKFERSRQLARPVRIVVKGGQQNYTVDYFMFDELTDSFSMIEVNLFNSVTFELNNVLRTSSALAVMVEIHRAKKYFRWMTQNMMRLQMTLLFKLRQVDMTRKPSKDTM